MVSVAVWQTAYAAAVDYSCMLCPLDNKDQHLVSTSQAMRKTLRLPSIELSELTTAELWLASHGVAWYGMAQFGKFSED
jgi:hypothetical protein